MKLDVKWFNGMFRMCSDFTITVSLSSPLEYSTGAYNCIKKLYIVYLDNFHSCNYYMRYSLTF